MEELVPIRYGRMLVSPFTFYRGARPRIDDGLLGERGRAVQRPWREWSAPTFEVDAEHPVPAGIDGESVVLQPPLQFRIRPGVLRVRIAHNHPGASPSALAPEGMGASLVELTRIAFGRDQKRPGSSQGRTA